MPLSHDHEEFEKLWRESRQIRGTSLGRDAWKRLRRNRTAMASLCFLIGLTTISILTPALPLQSPQQQHLGVGGRQFMPPNVASVRLELPGSETAQPLSRGLQEYDEQMASLQDRMRDIDPSERKELADAAETFFYTNNPLRRIWHEPGPVERGLIRLRLGLFGDWCVPSVCGSDQLGRDILSRLLWGARVSLSVGAVAALVSLAIGVLYGAVAGYLGGWWDAVMMRLVDILYSVPFIFVVIFAITILGQEDIRARLRAVGVERIMIFYLIIGAIYWLTMARVVRGQVISLKHEPFIEAAHVIGAGQWRIILRHLLPNVMSIVIVYLTLTIPSIMLFEAFLSFLGLGVEPPNVSWGLLANEGIQAITPIRIYWWMVLFPGLALGLSLLALNYLGDGLRDALDPRLKNR